MVPFTSCFGRRRCRLSLRKYTLHTTGTGIGSGSRAGPGTLTAYSETAGPWQDRPFGGLPIITNNARAQSFSVAPPSWRGSVRVAENLARADLDRFILTTDGIHIGGSRTLQSGTASFSADLVAGLLSLRYSFSPKRD